MRKTVDRHLVLKILKDDEFWSFFPYDYNIALKIYAAGIPLGQIVRISNNQLKADGLLIKGSFMPYSRFRFNNQELARLKEYSRTYQTNEYFLSSDKFRLETEYSIISTFNKAMELLDSQPFLADSRAILPNVIVLGMPKCATTWLHQQLKQIPGFNVPGKDLDFFSSFNFFKGIDCYKSYFSKSFRYNIDFSIAYLQNPHCYPRLAAAYQGKLPKMIIMVRRPSERLVSYITYRRFKGRGWLCLKKYVASANCFEQFIKTSNYKSYIKELLRYFPAHNIFVVFMEDIKKKPQQALIKIGRFMGYDKRLQLNIQHLKERIGKTKKVRPFWLMRALVLAKSFVKLRFEGPKRRFLMRILGKIEPLLVSRVAPDKLKVDLSPVEEQVQGLDKDYDNLKAWLAQQQILTS